MKKYFFCFLTLTLLVSCTQNDVEVSDQYVFTGRGGVKCYVNGMLLKPSPGFVYTHSTLHADSNNGTWYTSLSFVNSGNSNGLEPQSVFISLKDANPNIDMTGMVFDLKDGAIEGSNGYYSINVTDYFTNQTVDGELKVLYHNVAQGILGGTFWYDAENSAGEIVSIRGGEFDMKFF